MTLKDIDKFDLEGFLFTNFSCEDWTSGKALERAELEFEEIIDSINREHSSNLERKISPMLLAAVVLRQRAKEYDEMSAKDKKSMVVRMWNAFLSRKDTDEKEAGE